jgi:hypothetical protein
MKKKWPCKHIWKCDNEIPLVQVIYANKNIEKKKKWPSWGRVWQQRQNNQIHEKKKSK